MGPTHNSVQSDIVRYRESDSWPKQGITSPECMKSLSSIFFVGFPRSGTTVTFEAFCRHDALGWPSAYTEKFPRSPWINVFRRLLDNQLVRVTGRKAQYGGTIFGNRFLPQPNEAYRFWDLYTKEDFARGYLHNQVASPAIVRSMRRAVRDLLFWQGKRRFTAKITGPPRITYLNSIFPGSKFVHIIRDGRAAVHSLSKVNFWREKGGNSAPFWSGGLSAEDLRSWELHNRDPGVLAALQWKRILDIARLESQLLDPGCYLEIRYEDFIDSPNNVLRRIYAFCGLEDSSLGHEYLKECPTLINMNDKYRAEFTLEYVNLLTDLMQPILRELNYTEQSLL